MPASVERSRPLGSSVVVMSAVHCRGVGLTQYCSLHGAIGPDLRNQSIPFATSAGSGVLVGGVPGLPSWSNCSRTPSIRSRWLCTNVAACAPGSVAMICGVLVVMSSSRVTAPSGGKAQSKFRLLLALAGLGEVHGMTEIGPLV